MIDTRKSIIASDKADSAQRRKDQAFMNAKMQRQS